MTIERRNAKWKRRADDHLFEAIFMAMDEGAVLLNKGGKIGAVNPAAENMLGYAASELIGRSLDECLQTLHFITEDEAPLSSQLLSAKFSLLTGKPHRKVLAGMHRPDGTLVWLSINAQPLISNGEAGPYAVVTTFRDITEHKRARMYEHFRSQTLELLSEGTSLKGVLEGIVRGVEKLNPQMICSILLLDEKGKRLGEGVAPSLPDFYNTAIDGVEIGIGVGCCGTAAATRERVIVDDIKTHPYWAPYKELAAKAGLVACWSEPIRSSFGQVLGTFAIYHREVYSPTAFDISLIEKSARLASIAIERKRAEEALRASEERMRLFFERQLVGTAITSPEKGWVQVNDKICEMLGYTREELLRLTWSELTYPEDLAPDLTQFERLMNGQIDGYTLEKRFVRKDGSIVFTNLAVGCVRRANRSVKYVQALLEDITGRKRNEAELERHRHHLEKLVEDRTIALSSAKETAEAATRAKSHFLAAASHDMRQPLQAIRLFNDALSLTRLDERQMKISHNLAKSVSSLGELLNQLLDLSRLDAGMIEPQLVAIQAADLLGMIEAEFDPVFREKNLSLNLYCPRNSLALFSDETLLLTLLRNLVSNAVKYTACGGVLVSIRRRGNRALIQVWDTGIGIAPELSDSIFDEYFQIGNPERDRAKGVGLGLSIVRRLCELLGIEMGLQSRQGQGSVFELGVPLAGEPDVRAPAIPTPVSPDTLAPTRLAGKRIVVVEDDAIVAESIKLSLEMAGASVALFSTAEDALGSEEVIAADHYISDYRLPGMDGLQLLNTIQANSAAPIKAVILTGNTAPDQTAITQASRWEVLLKPINLNKLLSAMER
ncbi:MAG: PAS domain S-box protein [Sideroxyarcus sp.]|nr:PAS domain S-box protein [Sideroxyarcus sp.]